METLLNVCEAIGKFAETLFILIACIAIMVFICGSIILVHLSSKVRF